MNRTQSHPLRCPSPRSVPASLFSLWGSWLAVAGLAIVLAGEVTAEQDPEPPQVTPVVDPDPGEPQPQASADEPQVQRLIVVTGAPGEPEYGDKFLEWAARWSALAESQPGLNLIRIGPGAPSTGATNDPESDRDRLREAIQATDDNTVQRLWIVLIGHGTDDRSTSKFNLVGRDVSATELAGWLQEVDCPTVVLNCASASGGFIGKLKHPDRIVVTATRSGAQYNFARFGDFLSQAISNPTLDLDKDQQTSLLEAFIAASQQAQDFYQQEQRLATELALLDDNGDGLGTPGDWFSGVRSTRTSKTGKVDGRTANRVYLLPGSGESGWTDLTREQRRTLEDQIEDLRMRKSDFSQDQYYAKLEPLMLSLAQLYRAVEGEPDPPATSDQAVPTPKSTPANESESEGGQEKVDVPQKSPTGDESTSDQEDSSGNN